MKKFFILFFLLLNFNLCAEIIKSVELKGNKRIRPGELHYLLDYGFIGKEGLLCLTDNCTETIRFKY